MEIALIQNPRLGKFLSNLLIPVLVFAFNYSSLFSRNELLGDRGDARLSIVLYEHWYSFLTGNENLTSTIFFFPASNTLGLTDAYFAQGMVHSLFRFIGFGTIDSWVLTNIVLIFLGILGISRLASRIFQRQSIVFCVTLLASIAYPFVTQLGHLQSIGYLFVFWILDWAYLAHAGNTGQKKRAKIFLILGLPILALSSWYPFALLVLVTFLTFFVFLVGRSAAIWETLMSISKGIVAATKSSSNRNLPTIVVVISSICLWILWLRIYFPVMSALGTKSWGEINFFSPRLGDFINASYGSDGLHKVLYDRLKLSNPPTYERSLGLTFTLFFFVLFVSYLLIRKSKLISSIDQKISWSILCISIIPILLIIQDEFGRSAWYPFWKIIPGVSSIRAPFRVSIYSSWLLIFLLYYLIRNRKSIVIISITLLLFWDTSRVIPTDWDRALYLPLQTESMVSQIEDNKCDSFYSRPDSIGDNTIFQIDNEVIASTFGVPTINGYSGNFAKGWPTGLDPATDEQIISWFSFNAFKKDARVCIFDQSGKLQNVLVYKPN
jgi:hypothetical protein